MAPESLRDKQYSTKSDVWSFGILMFEVLTQQEPHADQDPITIGRKIRDEGLTPQLPSSVPSALSSVMNRCCQLSPNGRPSIEQVLEELESISL
jgi:serine/threonine protein kinase